MLAVGLQGSPRKNGSAHHLLSRFMDELAARGCRVALVDVPRKNIQPCRGCGFCEKKGFCVIGDDDMAKEYYGLLREAEIVVAASPVFFYSVTAQLKAFIDRTQAFWAKKYRFKLSDPLKKTRKGIYLSMGGSRGKQLFDGVDLVARYFFDAIDAAFAGRLVYRSIETPQDMQHVPSLSKDIEVLVTTCLKTARKRKRVLFACRENACRSQMAGAFAQRLGGDRLDVMTAGSMPAQTVNPLMMEAMAAKGFDMDFRSPRSLEQAIDLLKPEIIVTMGCGEECPVVPGASRVDWDLPDPAGKPLSFMEDVRDAVEERVVSLLNDLDSD